MEVLCQPSLNGQGGPIALIAIQAMNFGLKNVMIQQSIKVNGVIDDALCLYLFPHSLRHHATAWFDRLLRNSINTFEQMANMFLEKYFPPSMATKLRNEITNFRQPLKAEMAEINKNLMRVLQVNQQVKQITPNCETYGGPYLFNDCQATVSNTQNVYAAGAYQGNMITNPKEELKGITTRSGTAYQGPMIPTTYLSLFLVVERETDVTKDTVYPTNNRSTKDVQPLVVQTESPILNSEPDVAPIIEPVVAPLRDKANDQRDKFFQIFKDLNFNISFANALILMPKFSPTIKTLLTNKDKLSELARTPLNEHFSVVLLKKLPEKLADPGKFLILCDFPRMAECLALADLGASINLIPLSVWNKLSLPDLSPICITLELIDRLISRLVGVTEDVFVKVGTFHFSGDFVVVDFDADPRVPLILGRSFLKTGRALIDVFEGELTLRVGKEAITFNLDQTSRYSANYNDMTANRIDVIDMAYEEYSQEVLGFSDVITSGNPTPYHDPIVSTTSPTLTPFEESDFLLEEVDAFQALEDDPTSPEVDQSYVDTEGDILLLEAFLNDDPSLPPLNQGNYLPQVRKELKICEAKTDKSLIDEPLEVELKDLPPHLEYAFLEDNGKFSVIIAKDLSVEEKTALITVLIILMEEYFEPAVQHQLRVNPKIHDVIKNEVLKLLDAGLIYPIFDSPWRVCINYCKLNEATRKDHIPLPFMDQMLERLAGNEYYCFLDGLLGYFQILIDSKDQEKTTFTCPYRTSAYRRMPFGLCNALGTFQRCMMAIFHDMIEKTMEVFMDDFSEKSHFRVKEGIVLGHKISKNGIEVDKAKVDVIAKLPYPTTVKDHSSLKYLFVKKDFKARLLRWVLLLQEFKLKVIDTKGAENLATDHLSRLEKPHQTVLDPKEINESFLLETLNMVFSCIISGTTPFYLKSVRIKSPEGVYTTKKPLTFSKLTTMDPPRNIMARTTLLRRGNTYILVAVDYLSKWVKAKELPTNDARVVCKFLKNLFARFGTPHAIISDCRMHFCNDQFAKVMLKYGENRASWSDKLDDALWAFRMAYKTPIGSTPYKLVYRKACHLPIELEHKAYWALKHANFDLQTAGDHRKVQLNKLRDQAYENSLIYKEKTKMLHDSNSKTVFLTSMIKSSSLTLD
nr:reverse transcriptase domain-containing protein [Tanacetum cinerariifolium]